MTIKELKKYLKGFKDTDTVAVGMWANDGQRYYLPHTQLGKHQTFTPRKRQSVFDGPIERVAIVGNFDDCLAHMVERGWKVTQ